LESDALGSSSPLGRFRPGEAATGSAGGEERRPEKELMAGGRDEWGGEFWESGAVESDAVDVESWNGPCVGLRAFDDACFAQKFTLPRDIDENFDKMTHFYFRLMFALRHKNGMYQLSSH
jgi:hypothetical protein